MAAIDVLPMNQVNYADLVLPEATYLERYDFPAMVESAKQPFVATRFPVIEPLYESKPGWWITKQMAQRLGLNDYFPWTTPEEHLSGLLEPLRISVNALHARGAVAFEGRPYIEDRKPEDGPLFPTGSGKIELFSMVLKQIGADPPAGYFRLIYGRAPVHSFARSENNAILNALMPENEVWINAEAARDLGLSDGERVVLENQDGIQSLPVRAFVTKGIRRDCAYLVHGFGHRSPELRKAYGRGASDTRLMTRVKVDPLMGGTGMRVNFVRIVGK